MSCYAEEALLNELKQRPDVLMTYPCEKLPLLDDEGALPAVNDYGREITENLLDSSIINVETP